MDTFQIVVWFAALMLALSVCMYAGLSSGRITEYQIERALIRIERAAFVLSEIVVACVSVGVILYVILWHTR